MNPVSRLKREAESARKANIQPGADVRLQPVSEDTLFKWTAEINGPADTPFAGGVFDTDAQEYTLYPSADTNSERLPAYLALDLRVDKLFTFKRWQLELYADFLNVVRGENPEQVDYNYDGTEQRYITGLPFIPSLGFQADVTF